MLCMTGNHIAERRNDLKRLDATVEAREVMAEVWRSRSVFETEAFLLVRYQMVSVGHFRSFAD